MNKKWLFFIGIFALFYACAHKQVSNELVCIKILDRNGIAETVSVSERLKGYKNVDFSSNQPYKKVMRVFSKNIDGKTPAVITTYHPNGALWQYIEGKQNRASGIYKEWHPNGNVKIEAYVVGGPLDLTISAQSEWLFDKMSRVWDENGKLVAEMNYKNGLLEGVSTYYYASGKLKKQVPFKDNKVCGEILFFTEEGMLVAKESYSNDKKDGVSIAYWNEDLVQKVEVYEHGLLQQGQYFNMQKEEIAVIKNGMGRKAIFKNGYLYKLIEYKNGKREGIVEVFSKKGVLKDEHHLLGQKKNGEEITYYLNKKHTKKLSVYWKDDMLFGTVKTWYPNGNEESQKEMRENKKNGFSHAWYKDKSLMFVEEYEDDILKEGTYYKNK
jgi:antitoxin component YwqK of YwqJK toxin-antitoxin module